MQPGARPAGSQDDQVATEAIGHTILNRMRRNGTALVADVARAYARPTPPAEATVALAGRLLDGTSVDPTGGATHLYSPQRMSKEGQNVSGDVAGGVESVRGVTGKRGKTPVRSRAHARCSRLKPPPWVHCIGRRITHPGLDCSGDLLAVLPPSANRAYALREAYGYVVPHSNRGGD